MERNDNLIRALLRLGDKYHQEREKRFKLIGSVITLECRANRHRHSVRSFDETCEVLEATDTDVLEAMQFAYCEQLHRQHEGAKAPVTETI